MIELFKAGGPLMYALLAAALLGIAVTFERFVVLHRIPSPQKADRELENIETTLREGGLEGCAQTVSKGKGILNYIFARLLKRYDTLVIDKKDLEKEIEEGNFREELYYRLNVIPIEVPSLQNRQEDIPLLVKTFLDESAEQNQRKVKSITPEAIEILQTYTWP